MYTNCIAKRMRLPFVKYPKYISEGPLRSLVRLPFAFLRPDPTTQFKYLNPYKMYVFVHDSRE